MASCSRLAIKAQKKADVVEHPKVLHHVGLLFNEPPATVTPGGLPFNQSSEDVDSTVRQTLLVIQSGQLLSHAHPRQV